MHLDHVGVACGDAAELAASFAELFDAEIAHEEQFDGMHVVFLALGSHGDGPYLELLEPLTDEGAVARFLDREGAGLHHVAVATSDIVTALETAETLGVETVDDDPRPGAWGHEVAFLHPDSTGGVLVEFVEH
ncbi:MAG: methylmalonyl-CoA epimerase [halophilic archaeon J07HB67]|jgi:methylmalonyl-CoA epimerase (EC 5.1.99.1)|nr:MAG: methylmalonyl-CoA epimerase [halophilic archaeon J07HB67]